MATEEQLARIEADIEAELDEAVEHAVGSPFPGLEELTLDVYGTPLAIHATPRELTH